MAIYQPGEESSETLLPDLVEEMVTNLAIEPAVASFLLAQMFCLISDGWFVVIGANQARSKLTIGLKSKEEKGPSMYWESWEEFVADSAALCADTLKKSKPAQKLMRGYAATVNSVRPSEGSTGAQKGIKAVKSIVDTE